MISPDLIVSTTVYLPSVFTELSLKLNRHMLFVTVMMSGKLQTLNFRHFLLLSKNCSGETGKGYRPVALSCLDPLSYASALHLQRLLSEPDVNFFFSGFFLINILQLLQIWEESGFLFLFYRVILIIHTVDFINVNALILGVKRWSLKQSYFYFFGSKMAKVPIVPAADRQMLDDPCSAVSPWVMPAVFPLYKLTLHQFLLLFVLFHFCPIAMSLKQRVDRHKRGYRKRCGGFVMWLLMFIMPWHPEMLVTERSLL